MKKRLLCGMLAAVIALLAGCGGAGESAQMSSQPSPEVPAQASVRKTAMPYYSAEFLLDGLNFNGVRQYRQWKNRLLCASYEGENVVALRKLSWRDLECTEETEIPLALTDSQVIAAMDVTEDGTIYLLTADYVSDALSEDGVGFVKSDLENYHLLKLTGEGEVLSDHPALLEGECRDLTVTEQGEIYVVQCRLGKDSGWFDDHSIVQLDENGNVVDTYDPDASIYSLEKSASGNLYMVLQREQNQIYPFKMDPETQPEAIQEEDGDMTWPEYYVYDRIYVLDDDGGFYIYDQDGQGGLQFRWGDLPVTLNSGIRLVAVEDENTWIFTCATQSGAYLFRVHGQTEPPPETEKIELVLGVCGDSTVASNVVEFNILHPDVNLVIRDYRTLVQDPDDTEQMTELLNQDILNGNGPDILLLDSVFTVGAYMDNGYLTDLQPLMDGDETLNPENYFSGIWSCGNLRGKQYAMPTRFFLETLMARKGTGEDGWTPSECLALSQSTGTPACMTRDLSDWKRVLLGPGLSSYIDGSTCAFDTGEFAALLELLSGNYAMNLDDSDSEANFPLRSGRVLTQYTNLRPDTLLFTDALFGEDWTPLGFPTPDKSTAIMDVWMAFGIAETCQNKEAAWQYIRMEMDGEGMVSQSANRKYSEEELEQAALPVEDPDALANHAGYSIDEQELEPKPITKEQAENYLQLLENAGTAMVDPEVTAIVQEETEAFFAGDKTAEDTAKIIQNRVSIYLGEQS